MTYDKPMMKMSRDAVFQFWSIRYNAIYCSATATKPTEAQTTVAQITPAPPLSISTVTQSNSPPHKPTQRNSTVAQSYAAQSITV